MALSVEKTSKRGGRIVHEKDLMPAPPPTGAAAFAAPFAPPPPAVGGGDHSATPPYEALRAEGANSPTAPADTKKSTADLMRNPSKVVLCKVRSGFTLLCLFLMFSP